MMMKTGKPQISAEKKTGRYGYSGKNEVLSYGSYFFLHFEM
jgi:hypothetical protein